MTDSSLRFLDCERSYPICKLPVRTTRVETSNGVVLISPGSCLDESELTSCGPVTDIVAQNLFHLDGIPKAAKVFPEARIWGPKGCHGKMPRVHWHGVLDETTWPFQNELALLHLEGVDKIGEALFFHGQSRTLIVADFLFNLLHVSGLGARLMYGFFGTYRKFALSKLFLMMVQNRSAFEKSISRILELDFDRIVMAHGDIIESGGKTRIQEALLARGVHVDQ